MSPISTANVVGAYVTLGMIGVSCAWVRFKINGRRFRRRTIGGGQRFPSYGWAVITQSWEALAMTVADLLMSIALLAGLGFGIWLWKYA